MCSRFCPLHSFVWMAATLQVICTPLAEMQENYWLHLSSMSVVLDVPLLKLKSNLRFQHTSPPWLKLLFTSALMILLSPSSRMQPAMWLSIWLNPFNPVDLLCWPMSQVPRPKETCFSLCLSNTQRSMESIPASCHISLSRSMSSYGSNPISMPPSPLLLFLKSNFYNSMASILRLLL